MATKLKAIKRISDLVPDDRNANRGTERGNAFIERSLREYGAGRSILIDRKGKIIAGNKTVENAAAIGLENLLVVQSDGRKIVAVQRTDLDMDRDPRARELALADNRSGDLNMEWNPEVLADLGREIDLSPFFTTEELADLIGKDANGGDGGGAPEPQLDKADELRKQWKVATGQLWEIPSKTIEANHRLMCGDATSGDVAVLMGNRRANAVLTDPPYGQNQPGVTNDSPEQSNALISGAVKQLPCDDAVIVAFQSPRTFPVWLDAIRANGITFERMLWLCKDAQCTYPWRGWIMKSEAILVASKGDPHWNDVHPYMHDCYRVPEVSGELGPDSGWHGSVKPIAIVRDIAQRISAPSDLIYEPFSGSGTTLVAAEQTGRLGYGMEIEPKYVAVALQRMADMGLQPKLAA